MRMRLVGEDFVRRRVGGDDGVCGHRERESFFFFFFQSKGGSLGVYMGFLFCLYSLVGMSLSVIFLFLGVAVVGGDGVGVVDIFLVTGQDIQQGMSEVTTTSTTATTSTI